MNTSSSKFSRLSYPSGYALNPKSSELQNAVFAGIEKGSYVVFARTGDAADISDMSMAWNKIRQFDEGYDELERFSRIVSLEDVAQYAQKHGPLFGRKYDCDGVIKEPLRMWFFAVRLIVLGLQLKAAYDSGSWFKLQGEEVAFEFELLDLNEKQKQDWISKQAVTTIPGQPYIAHATTRFLGSPLGYFLFALGNEDFMRGGLLSRKWDDPVIETKMLQVKPISSFGWFDKTIEERAQTDIENSAPNLSVALATLKDLEMVLPLDLETVRVNLEDSGPGSSETGRRLCRLMSEALISMHCRNVHFGWVDHEFRPVFFERIRYLWYLYSINKDNKAMDFCANCGRPFFKSRKDKKHCGTSCRLAANKR